MTPVRLALAAPTSTGTVRRPSGSVEWRPTKRRDVAGDVVLPAPFTVGLADTPPVIDVAPTEPGWAWQVVERVQGGSPKARYLTVPDSASVVDYADLIAVDPATLDPLEEPQADWWAALNYMGTVTVDPTDPDVLLLGGNIAQQDPDDADAVILTGV